MKLPKAKRGFVLLPRRWVVERCFAWMARFRRLAKDFERLPKTVEGLHLAVFARIMLARSLNRAISDEDRAPEFQSHPSPLPKPGAIYYPLSAETQSP